MVGELAGAPVGEMVGDFYAVGEADVYDVDKLTRSARFKCEKPPDYRCVKYTACRNCMDYMQNTIDTP